MECLQYLYCFLPNIAYFILCNVRTLPNLTLFLLFLKIESHTRMFPFFTVLNKKQTHQLLPARLFYHKKGVFYEIYCYTYYNLAKGTKRATLKIFLIICFLPFFLNFCHSSFHCSFTYI